MIILLGLFGFCNLKPTFPMLLVVMCCFSLCINLFENKTTYREDFQFQLKEKLEKTHEAMQKARSQRQLEQAKQANIEKLVNNFLAIYSHKNYVLVTRYT